MFYFGLDYKLLCGMTKFNYFCYKYFCMRVLYIFMLVLFSLDKHSYAQSNLTLKTPFNDAVFSHTAPSILFRWNHDGSSTYTLEVAQNIDFSDALQFISPSSSFSLGLDNLNLGSYFWRIQSGLGNTSAVRTFRVLNLASLGVLVYHIDAQDSIVVSFGKVTQWNNQASQQHNAVQSTASLAPDFVDLGPNNNPVVRFGGPSGLTQHRMSLGTVDIQQANFSLFMVMRQQTVNSALPYVLGFQGGGRVGGVHVRGTFGTYSNFGIVYDPPLEERRPNTAGNFNWRIHSFSNNQIFFDAIQVGGYTGAGVSGLRFNMIGTRPDVTSLNFHGDIAEILAFNSSLSTSDRSSVEQYLASKYTPYPDLGDDINLCASSVTLGPINDPAFTSVQWSNGQTNVPTIQVTQNGWYWVQAVAFGRTMRDSIFVSGLVPTPQLNLTQNQTICFGNSLNINYTNTLPSGITAQWSTGATGNSISVSEPGSYAVVFQNANGCQISSQTLEVAVNYFPQTRGLGEDRTFCLNSQLFFEYGNQGMPPYTHVWSTGSTAGSIPITLLGTNEYRVAVTDAMGCVARDTVRINLLNIDGPTVSFSYDTTCVLTPTIFTDNSILGSGDSVLEYLWIFPNGSSAEFSPMYTPNTNLPYPVELQLTTALGCRSSFRDTVVMLPEPKVQFSIPTLICQDANVMFTGSQTSFETIMNWEWRFGSILNPIATANGSSVTYAFPNHGNINVTLLARDVNGCIDTVTQLVNVRPRPQVVFGFTEVCAGNAVQFNNQSSILAPAQISGQLWTFHDGVATTQLNPVRIYPNPGYYNVTLQVNGNNGCSAQLSQQIQIHALPQLSYTTDAACAGIAAHFNDQSTVLNGSIGSVEWTFDGALTLQGANVVYSFPNGGNRQVLHRVVSDFGCVRSASYNLNLTPVLKANFELNPNVIIVDYPIEFENLSVGQNYNAWWFNGEELFNSSSPVLTFGAEQIGEELEVMLVVGNDVCFDTLIRNYTVLENRTDLAVKQLFVSEINGFFVVGVELENRGFTPITQADLNLRSPHIGLIKETWQGNLDAGQSEIYVMGAQILNTLSEEQALENYICVEAVLKLPLQFVDQDLSNNAKCKSLNDDNKIWLQSHPNPSGDKFTLQVLVPVQQEVSIKLFDSMGREIEELGAGLVMQAGLNLLEIQAADWPSGVYHVLVYSQQGRVSTRLTKID
jgi:PKD repeat protein